MGAKLTTGARREPVDNGVAAPGRQVIRDPLTHKTYVRDGPEEMWREEPGSEAPPEYEAGACHPRPRHRSARVKTLRL